MGIQNGRWACEGRKGRHESLSGSCALSTRLDEDIRSRCNRYRPKSAARSLLSTVLVKQSRNPALHQTQSDSFSMVMEPCCPGLYRSAWGLLPVPNSDFKNLRRRRKSYAQSPHPHCRDLQGKSTMAVASRLVARTKVECYYDRLYTTIAVRSGDGMGFKSVTVYGCWTEKSSRFYGK